MPAPALNPESDPLAGRVLSVNVSARFVVLRFPIESVPPPGSRLGVYREGVKVADIKITGPQRENHTVADILAGECRTGDVVKPQ